MRFFVTIFLCGLGLVCFGQDSTKVKKRIEVDIDGGTSWLILRDRFHHTDFSKKNYGGCLYYSISDRIDIGLGISLSNYTYSSVVLQTNVFGKIQFTDTSGKTQTGTATVGSANYQLKGSYKYFLISPTIRFCLFKSEKFGLYLSHNLFSYVKFKATATPTELSRTYYSFPVKYTDPYVEYWSAPHATTNFSIGQMLTVLLKYNVSKNISLFGSAYFYQSFPSVYYKSKKLHSFYAHDNLSIIRTGFNFGVSYSFDTKYKKRIFKKTSEGRELKNMIYFNKYGINYERKIFLREKFGLSQIIAYRVNSYKLFTTASIISFKCKAISPQFGFLYSYNYYRTPNNYVYSTNTFALMAGFRLHINRRIFVQYNVLPVRCVKYNYDVSKYYIAQKMYYLNEHFASLGFSF